MSGKFRFPVKTAVMFVAAVLYIVLIADWCVPGYGLHLAAVVLGGHGQKVRARYERLQREARERAEVDAIDVLRFNRRHLRANAVMGTINGVRGNTAGLQVMLTNLRRIAGLSKTHQKEVEVLGK